MRRSRPLVAVIASLALVPGLVAVGALAAPTAGAPVATATSASLLRPADGVPRATITRHVARHPAHRRQGLHLARVRRGLRDRADQHLQPGRHRDDGPRPAVALARPRQAVRRRGHPRRHQPADRHPVHRHRATAGSSSRLLADPKAGPGQETRALVRGYAAGINRYLRTIGGVEPRHRPVVPRPRLRPARRHRPRHLVRRSTPRTCSPPPASSCRRSRTRRRRRPTDPGLPAPPVSAGSPPRRRTCRPRRRCGPGWARTPTRRSARTRPRSARTSRRPARAWCSATRTSRGAAATGSPSSSSPSPATTTSPAPG